jgi:hypothetical protein
LSSRDSPTKIGRRAVAKPQLADPPKVAGTTVYFPPNSVQPNLVVETQAKGYTNGAVIGLLDP